MNFRSRPFVFQTDVFGGAIDPNKTRVSKRLKVGSSGTSRWMTQFGSRLVCVRYREEPQTGRKFTTVELVVDERPPNKNARFLVKIEFHESGLRQRIREHGGKWDAQRELWILPYSVIIALGLETRIIEKHPDMATPT